VLSQVEVTADASPVTSAVDAAVAAADAVVPVEVDASGVTSAVDEAVGSVDGTVPVEVAPGDLATVAGEISAAVADADTTVTVDADTEQAVAAVADLGSGADASSTAVDDLAGSTRRLGAVAAFAAGDLADITEALPDSGVLAATAGGLAAVAVAATASFRAALESDTAENRLASTFGDLAEQVQNVDVGGLTGDLTALATQAGSSDERLKVAISRIAELGESAGATDPQIVSTTQNIEALALRAAAANPTLGEAGDVADRLTNAFARGGRALAPYGLDLQAAEINARALANTGKTAATDLTLFEKATAGSALAVEQLGDRLGTDFQAGTKQTVIGLRSVKQEFDNALEAIGQPLLGPVLEELRQGEPVLVELASIFGEAAVAVLPLGRSLLEVAAPALHQTVDVIELVLPLASGLVSVLDAIPAPVLVAAGTFLTLRAGMGGLDRLFERTAAGALGMAHSVGRQGLAASLGGLVSPLGVVTVGIAGLVTVIASHRAEVAKEKAAVAEFTAELAKQETSLTDLTRAKLEARTEDRNQNDWNQKRAY